MCVCVCVWGCGRGPYKSLKSSPSEEEEESARRERFARSSLATSSFLFFWRLPTLLRGRLRSAPELVASESVGGGGGNGGGVRRGRSNVFGGAGAASAIGAAHFLFLAVCGTQLSTASRSSSLMSIKRGWRAVGCSSA